MGFPGKGLDDVERHAGLRGGAGTGGDQHAVRIERLRLGGRDLIVAENALRTPNWPKYWTRLKVNES